MQPTPCHGIEIARIDDDRIDRARAQRFLGTPASRERLTSPPVGIMRPGAALGGAPQRACGTRDGCGCATCRVPGIADQDGSHGEVDVRKGGRRRGTFMLAALIRMQKRRQRKQRPRLGMHAVADPCHESAISRIACRRRPIGQPHEPAQEVQQASKRRQPPRALRTDALQRRLDRCRRAGLRFRRKRALTHAMPRRGASRASRWR